MHWLLASFKKSSRRLQIEDLILLIMRILILVLLALALARPFLQESGLLGGPQPRAPGGGDGHLLLDGLHRRGQDPPSTGQGGGARAEPPPARCPPATRSR